MRKILITGANRGIGLGLTKYFLNDGWSVIAASRSSSDELQSLAGDFADSCQLETLDVKSDVSVSALAKKIDSTVDVLINNAGMMRGEPGGFAEIDLGNVAETIEVNATSAMRVAKAMLPLLDKSSQPIVVNMSSMMGSVTDNTSGGYYAYRMSKAAMNMFNKSFSHDFPKIASIVMHPGWVQTDMGGSNAPTSVEDSVRGMGEKIKSLSLKDSGKFFSFRGDELPW